ncbi:thioredoxin domain-containing protein [Gordonia sp. VNK21]|uniref:thioredoxin domain-containing protein n=1 Tax=Gordonia sp. VNK21 TaxID=3382483 RepID=UPI0038D3B83D
MTPVPPADAGTPGHNRLGDASSPYLRQHADNPVHWFPWCDEAFEQARTRDVPVLLSVGYAACHWCHVMAHESFENAAIAEQMNRDFVCIKVDREERPDIDAIYMAATVATTGQGGWPMTCFLTPEGRPFYCGTYYPPVGRPGMPGFPDVLTAISRTWTDKRDEVRTAGERITEHLQAAGTALPAGPALDAAALSTAIGQVLADEDPVHGGFGGAPKFPPSALLEALVRAGEYLGADGEAALAAAVRTAQVMARGGLYDQLDGGFARYTVDGAWVVPHFEKMLYDNALLLRGYAHLARRTGDPLARRIAGETVGFLDEQLWTGTGFASSLDADTDGVEGLTYVWTPAQLREVLGDDDGDWAAGLFAVTDAGTFEHGTSTLQLPADPGDAGRFDSVRSRLRAARAQRPQPDRDDKVVVVWNALAITALAEAGAGLGEPSWIDRAADCAEQLWSRHRVDGVLRRVSLGGRAGAPLAALDDHAAFVTALLALHQVTGQRSWRDRALELLDTAIAVFADDAEPGAWYDAPPGDLLTRPRDPVDGATPSGASLLAEALLTASLLADDEAAPRYRELADRTLARAGLIVAQAPRSAGHWMAVALTVVGGPLQVAVAETGGGAGDLADAAHRLAPGGAVVVSGARDALPLLDGRGPVDGADAAYVCRGQVCGLPVTDEDGLAALLR